MEIKKGSINLKETKGRMSAGNLVSGDVVISDIMPDIEEVVMADAKARITDTSYKNGKLDVSGVVDFTVLYKPEEGSELKSFGNGAFKNLCIRDVLVLPEGIETLTAYCMPADCAGIILPQSLRKIASYAFDKYKTETALTVFIYLPNGVTEIGAKARCTTFIVYTFFFY